MPGVSSPAHMTHSDATTAPRPADQENAGVTPRPPPPRTTHARAPKRKHAQTQPRITAFTADSLHARANRDVGETHGGLRHTPSTFRALPRSVDATDAVEFEKLVWRRRPDAREKGFGPAEDPGKHVAAQGSRGRRAGSGREGGGGRGNGGRRGQTQQQRSFHRDPRRHTLRGIPGQRDTRRVATHLHWRFPSTMALRGARPQSAPHAQAQQHTHVYNRKRGQAARRGRPGIAHSHSKQRNVPTVAAPRQWVHLGCHRHQSPC
jgi:hypothetical protein